MQVLYRKPLVLMNALARMRHASTSTSLTWPEYLQLRKSARRAGLLASIPCTALGFGLSASQLGNIEADPTATIFGIEQIWIYGLAVVGCTGLGWLLGPSIGNFIWRQSHKSIIPAMEIKERQFYQHIQQRRVDPSRQSVHNPTPDYYAEKVGSIKDYRQWLRDQAVYRRKSIFGGDGKL